VGPSGQNCQKLCWFEESMSIHLNAFLPRSPIPYGEGREVGCRKMPEALMNLDPFVVVPMV